MGRKVSTLCGILLCDGDYILLQIGFKKQNQNRQLSNSPHPPLFGMKERKTDPSSRLVGFYWFSVNCYDVLETENIS